jgi:hypothetical protein
VIVDYSPGVRSHTRIPLAPPALLHIRPPQHSTSVNLEAGQTVRVVLEHHVGSSGSPTSFVLGGVSFQLNIEEPYRPDDEESSVPYGWRRPPT